MISKGFLQFDHFVWSSGTQVSCYSWDDSEVFIHIMTSDADRKVWNYDFLPLSAFFSFFFFSNLFYALQAWGILIATLKLPFCLED